MENTVWTSSNYIDIPQWLASSVRKVRSAEQGVTEGQSGGNVVFPRQCQNFLWVIVSKPDTTSTPDAVRRCAVDGTDVAPVIEIFPVFPEKGQEGTIQFVKLE